MRYSESNIEDWDFRHCGHDDPEYDVEADLFVGTHFTTAVAVDAVRVMVITTLIDKGVATVEEDPQNVRLMPHGDGILQGWKSGTSRLSRDGRFERKVVEALRRENRKYGRLRMTILPPSPGLRGNPSDDSQAGDETIAVDIEARDKAFYDFVNAVGGYEPFVTLVQEHAANAGVELANDQAMLMIEGWHQYGVVRSMSIGEYLDEAWQGVEEDDVD